MCGYESMYPVDGNSYIQALDWVNEMSANELWTEFCGLGQRPDGVQTVLTTDTLSSETRPKPADPHSHVLKLLHISDCIWGMYSI